MSLKSSLSKGEPLIYLVTDGLANSLNFISKSLEATKLIESAVKSGIPLIQIREKDLPAKLLFELASRAASITKNSATKLLVNGRVDIAHLAGADGVHLPSDSVPIGVVRKAFGKEFMIGASVHSLSEARLAENNGADFVTFGPVFMTPSKEKYGEPQGIEKLNEVSQNLSIPVIGIGGINELNYSEVLQSGAKGFAAIRFLSDPEKLSGIVEGAKR